ncbi:hypothetical protein [Arthrobacter sp. Rue61a]|uniref:hypothetical protein n=1 Tax=Arthrobacter sp. Rue61a TaxID=1118963 RepID=UPI00031C319C|nr:hypothetical protein [Arthrobacter sp. Rue61a]
MTTPTQTNSIAVTAINRASMDQQLWDAVNTLKAESLAGSRCGILVTRNSPDNFTVELSSSVPFGMIYEQQSW